MKFILNFSLFTVVLTGCQSQKNRNNNTPPELTPEKDFLRIGVADSLKHLWPILDSVYYYDQKYRKVNRRDLIKRYAKEINKIDSLNLIKVIPVIEKYGILGMGDIGMIGHMAIVMTIQHADLAIQEKYLPLFKAALKRKKVMPSTYAMLEDRVATKNRKMQLYGTQVMLLSDGKAELFPVIEPDSINVRRKSIGMAETIEVYLKQFGIDWNLEKYKNDLPRLIEKYKIK